MISILLVDDQNIIRQGLQVLLEQSPNLKVVGTAYNGNNAIEQIENLKPDVVLIDIEMPKMNGITATKKISRQFPQTKVIVLSSYENHKYILEALRAGAEGYLLKNTSSEDLEEAILSVHRGHLQIESRLLKKALDFEPIVQLNKSIEANKSDVVREQSLQQESCNSHSNTNNLYDVDNKYLRKVGEKTESNRNGSRLKGEQTIVEPVFKGFDTEIKTKADFPEETSTSNTKQLINKQKKAISLKILKHGIFGLIIITILLFMAISLIRFLNRTQTQNTSASIHTKKLPEIKKIAALGRIEPLGEIISLSAPTSQEAAQVEQLFVKIGERVKKDQIIAILDGRQRLQATLDEAKTKLAVSQSRLEKIKAGAKQGTIKAKQAAIANFEAELAGEIQIQRATIGKLNAKLDNAQTEFQRNQQLFNEGAISASELDSKRLSLKTAQEQLKEARATFWRTEGTLNAQIAESKAILEETAEILPIDLEIAQAELKQAQAAVARAAADMELGYVRASVDGEILDIHTRPGEALNKKGIVEIGQTKQMIVVAEIDQNDIDRVKIDQKVVVTSGVFSKKLYGKVHQVGSLIGKNDILDTDPVADEDSRVVEVEILLNPQDSQKVAKLSNLEVDVVIEL